MKLSQEQNILASIEEGIRKTIQDFDSMIATNANIMWDKQRQRVLEHFGLATAQFKDPNRSSLQQSALKSSFASKSTFGRSTPRPPPSNLGREVLGAQGDEFADVVFGDAAISSSTYVLERHRQMAFVVAQLNNARQSHTSYDLVEAFTATVRATAVDIKTQQVYDTWKLLGKIVGQLGGSLGQEGCFRSLIMKPADSHEAANLRTSIAKGAQSFLEDQ